MRARQPAALDLLRQVPFVRDLRYDSGITVRTPAGTYRLTLESKRSFLTRAAVSQFLAWAESEPRKVLLLARHIPPPVADRLIEAHVNFVDDAGNIHLELGDRYNWTVVGKPALGPVSQRRPITPAQVQLLFQFMTHPESMSWSVRRLESAAGISKSKAAQARQELIAEKLLVRKGKQYQLGSPEALADRLVSGYAHVLRPKIVLGRFQPPEKTPESFLARLRKSPPADVRYALTGGPAADLLQRYYRGPEVPMFVQPASGNVAQQLRLLPDREGPVTLLRAFGDVVFWDEKAKHTVAPPWLVYAELLTNDDPRAQEAAREFRREFLS